MPPPKSQKLLSASKVAELPVEPPQDQVLKTYQPGEAIPVKPVRCFNDFVAILQFKIESSVLMAGETFKQEGMVVGVGPGLPTNDGNRCPSQLKIGDVVVFYGNPTTKMEPKSGVYAGQRVVIVPERSVICALKDTPFVLASDDQ